MRNQDLPIYEKLSYSLIGFEQEVVKLKGIASDGSRHAFLCQLIESLRRIKFYKHIRESKISSSQATYQDTFDPLKAATYYLQSGNIDEAFWLVFLATHFGKNGRTGWKLVRDVYWALGEGFCWSWERVSPNPEEMSEWLRNNYANLKEDGVARNFGNHRKYETLKPLSRRSTWRVIESYIRWIGESKSHEAFINSFQIFEDEKLLFRAMYNSMSSVLSFARTGKFDYLTTLSNLGVAPITADSAYLYGATGPLRGARLLFGGSLASNISAGELENLINDLDEYLEVGMQVLEDSVCNWQKSPNIFVPFRG